MTTLTAVQAATGPEVTLTLTPSETVTTIIRSDVNGNAPVRVRPGNFPRTAPLTLTDWEAAAGRVTYTAGDAVARPALAWENPWLVFPFRVGLAQELLQVSGYSASRASLGIIHQVPDRQDPLVALGRLAYRTGTLDMLCPDLASARTLERSLDKAGLAMLKTPDQPGMDMYFTASDAQVRPEDGGHWTLSVSYVETARPTANLSSWTLGALKASFATFGDVKAAFADFDALARNDRTL